MNQQLHILLVDDDDAIEVAVRFAMNRRSLKHTLTVAKNGAIALDILRGTNPDSALPSDNRVILLDCEMPIMDGIEFLRELRSDPRLRRIPVVMLTNCVDEEERNKAYDLGICGYIYKPLTLEGFVETISTVDRFWEMMELPA